MPTDLDPYAGISPQQWPEKTEELVAAHPLSREEIVEVVLEAWDRILETRIAGELQIGVDAMLSPQMMGNFLHSVIASLLTKRYPSIWREGVGSREKDLVYEPDEWFSTEIKTSSNKSNIFANRSYAQPSAPGSKNKGGYYIAVNFEKFERGRPPRIVRIALGWLSHADWVPQASPTGQQASLTVDAKLGKFVRLYPKSGS